MCVTLMLVLFVASFVLSQLLAPKPKIENARPAGLGDFSAPTATEARTVPLIFGTVRQRGPNVVWYGDLNQVPIRQSIRKNLFAKTNITIGYQYYLGIQFGLCRGGPDVQLRRIWIGEDEVYSGTTGLGSVTAIPIDLPELFGGNVLGSGGVQGLFRFYPGTADQAVNAYLEDFVFTASGSTRTPNWTGTCYGMWEGGWIGNSTSLAAWSFELQRITNGLNLDAAEAIINSRDSNPMNVIYELITNSEWGFGEPPADIDLVNFEDAANTLAAENNGFSMIVDSGIETKAFLEELERQINGKVFLDQQDGKWRVKLARGDYDVDDVPLLSKATNIVSVEDFTRGSWVDTQNQVRLYYFDRQNDYQERPAFASDMANAMIQGGSTVLTMRNEPVEVRFPGIKDAALANQTVWRVLRSVSYPLAKAKITVDRSLWDVRPYDVVAWTDDDLGFVKLPMRVSGIDYGNIDDGKIVLDCVQDIWKYATGAFGNPPGTGWNPPVDDLEPFDDTFIIEAPRALVTRDDSFIGVYADRVACAAGRKGPEVAFDMLQRAFGSGPYTSGGVVAGIVRIGELTGSLAKGAVSGVSFNVACGSSSDKAAIIAAFVSQASLSDIGKELTNLIRIGNEFFLAATIASGTGNTIDFSDVYRQVLDTVQVAHAGSTDVWCLFMGLGVTDPSYTPASTTNVKLQPISRSDKVAEASISAVNVTMDDRLRRPYPPGEIFLNGTSQAVSSVSLEGTGSGDDTGVELTLTRRDYRAPDEIYALTQDAAFSFGDFPTLNSTTYTVEVRNDPTGANTLLFTTTASAAEVRTIKRTQILRYTSADIPSTLRFTITASHTYEGVVYAAKYGLVWDFAVVSALSTLFNFGARDSGVNSSTYTASPDAGVWTLSIATALPTGNVQVKIAGGAFATVISTGNTSGTFFLSGLGEAVVVKHDESTSGFMTALLLRNPSSTAKAYGVLYKT